MDRKTYVQLLIVLAGVMVFIGGIWLYSRYQSIKASVFEERKAEIASTIHGAAASLIKPEDFTSQDPARHENAFEPFFLSIQSPELLRIKIWDRNFTILWSNLKDLIGERFPDNLEVKEALEGKIEFELSKVKFEHFSERRYRELTETYVPIPDANGNVVAVIEVYHAFFPLQQEIHSQFQKSVMVAALIVVLGHFTAALVLRFFPNPINKKVFP